MATDKDRVDLYRVARDLIREKFDDDPIADACDDRIKQLDPPKPQYEDGLYEFTTGRDDGYAIHYRRKDGEWLDSLGEPVPYPSRGWTARRVRILPDDQHVIVPVVTLATNAVRSVANNMAPGSAAEAVLNAYVEAVEQAQSRS